MFTGCGANANTTTTVTTCAIPYGTVSGETYTYPQSTTGNISGVFDMSGGASEKVMGHLGTDGDSYGFGFDSAWFTTSANSKYFDLYDSSVFTGNYSTNITFCTLATCGGHALNEITLWYSNYVSFPQSNGRWFFRGAAGVFYAGFGDGSASWTSSFRVVLANVGG